jgi:hypothetical protein
MVPAGDSDEKVLELRGLWRNEVIFFWVTHQEFSGIFFWKKKKKLHVGF